MQASGLAAAAAEFMAAAGPAAPGELVELLDHAAETLGARFPRAAPAEIRAAALAAWSEAEGLRTRCHVDLDASTPYLLWLVDPVAGTRRPIPVADLVRILGPRAAG